MIGQAGEGVGRREAVREERESGAEKAAQRRRKEPYSPTAVRPDARAERARSKVSRMACRAVYGRVDAHSHRRHASAPGGDARRAATRTARARAPTYICGSRFGLSKPRLRLYKV